MTETTPAPTAEADSTADPAEPASPQRLYLHVGLPKSGSTYLQGVLGNNRAVLRDHGYLYPYVHQEGMFHAAVEMTGRWKVWGLDPEAIAGTFAHLVRRTRRLGGTGVISHELFGRATVEQITQIRDQLEGFEVHLVVTARDLGRTLTAEWQEQVKNGSPKSFADYAAVILAQLPERAEDAATLESFWRSQNLGALLERWSVLAPPERTHVVVCPRSASDPAALWKRFAEAIELPADVVDLDVVPVRNESLGTAQIAFLRRVTQALDGRLEQPWHSLVAKRWFAQTLLSTARSGKPVTPAADAERLAGVSRAWIARLEQGGYRVHGPLEELVPVTDGRGQRHPDDAADAEMLAGLPEVVAEMLVRVREHRVEIAELRETVAGLEAELAELHEQEEIRRQRWRRRWQRLTGRTH